MAIAVAMAGVVVGRPFLSRRLRRRGEGPLTPGVHGGFVGQRALALDEIGEELHPGHVRLAGETWLAFSDDHQPIADGCACHRDRRPRDDARRPTRVRACHTGELRWTRELLPLIVAFIIAILFILFAFYLLRNTVNLVQQGFVGVTTRLGEFRAIHEPGLAIIAPFIDKLVTVDMREYPRPGDRQEVITKDNVVVSVNATIFTQVVDAKQALFSIANFDVAIDALARTALRSVIGTLSLDEALSERERINVDVQEQMEAVTDKWGIRINRIEIVEITPPPQILQALALQKQADQEKRAKILQSEGIQQSAVNVADGDRQAAIKNAEGERQAAILRAEGNRQAAILEAEGRARAIETVYGAITAAAPNPTLVAILQLDTLSKFALSPNTKIVIPAESAALMGAVQAIQSVLAQVPPATE